MDYIFFHLKIFEKFENLLITSCSDCYRIFNLNFLKKQKLLSDKTLFYVYLFLLCNRIIRYNHLFTVSN